MKFRKWIATALAVCMLLPTTAMAIDVETEPIILGSEHIENPYGSIIDPSLSVIDDEESTGKTFTADDMPTTWYTDVQQAANALLTGMKDRESEIMIGVTADVYNTMGGNDAWNTLYSTALAHDPTDPKGGDYTGLLFKEAGGLRGAYGENYFLYYTVTYRTTKAQEDAVDAKVAELVAEWKAENLSQYDTIQTIYDYITTNVHYDNDGLHDDTDVLKYTAYGALCEGSAVCMGISILFYRLALEMDVDARFIQSIKSENHAWDIVQLGDYYYNVDATWDLDEHEYESDRWFMKNMADFQVKEDGSTCHTRKDEYLTDAWNQAYPMAEKSYEIMLPDVTETEWNGITWQFEGATGTLTIIGDGKIPAAEEGSYPWNAHIYAVKNLVIEEGITVIPYGVLGGLNMLESITLPSTVKDMYVTEIPYLSALKTLTIASENPIYTTQDGVLFSNIDGYCTLETYIAGNTATSYTVPNDVDCIGTFAFTNQEYLQEVTIPNSVTKIWSGAFTFSFALTSITVAEDNPNYCSVNGILYNKDQTELIAYPYSYAVSAFTVPDTVTKLTSDILQTEYLEKLDIPASVESIGEVTHAISEYALKEIVVDDGNQNYCSVEGVLYDKAMTTLYWYPSGKTDTVYRIPDTVTTLGTFCLLYSPIKTLYMGEKVEQAEYVLIEDTVVTSIYFPGDFPTYFESAFSNVADKVTFYYPTGASGWTSPTMEINGVTYKTAAYDPDTEPEIPWNTWNDIKWYFDEDTGTLTIGGEGDIPNVSYSAYPWRSVTGKTKVLVFEEGITSVLGMAFSGMYNLTTLSIPASMKSIASGSSSLFASAYKLSNITAADGGTYYVQDGVLYTADTLVFYPAGKTNTSYTIPEGIVNIGAYAFPQNSSLTALTLPESLQNIEDSAMTMSNLTTLHIPKNVSSIHKYAFVFMTKLTAYTVDPENPNYTAVDGILYTKDMTTLMAYPDNHPATTFTVPDTVVEMDPAILHRSSNLKTLTLPASLTTIWTCRSYSGGCDLEEVFVDSANQNFCSVDGVLYSKDMTTLYYYPENKADTEFHIPDSVTTLAHASMFNLRKLNTLYFGSGITTVQMQFSISLLEKIYFPGDLPSWFSRAFSNLQYYGMLDTLTFYYPTGNTTWTDGSMTISGVTYKTASYTRYTAEDLTGDGSVDDDDLSLLQDYFSGKAADFDLTKADFNGDGVFTRADVMYLARALAGWAGYTLKGSN